MLKYKNLFLKNSIRKDFNKFSYFFKRFSNIISVDLGATNTCIAILETSGPRVIENAEGLRTTPTIITVDEDGSETLAVVSKRTAIEKMENSFYGFKFFFGRKYSDEFLKNIFPRYPFKIAPGPNDEILFLNSNNIQYTPGLSTTKYLAYIKEQAQSLTGKEINKCVLSLPRFIPEEGRNEIKEIFQNANLEILEILDESQAALKAYELDKNENIKNVLVFNYGGSNLSLTYLSKENKPEEPVKNEFEFISDKYDFEMGGVDIDKLIVNLLLEEFKKLNKMDVSKELYALQRITEAAEKVKIELSLSQQVEISLPFLAADHTGPKHLNLRFSRSKFENLIDPITSKLQKICLDFLNENNLPKEKIDEIIMIGGVCRIPKIQEIIKNSFGKEPNKSVNPEEAPAIGGAIMTKKIVEKLNQIKFFTKMPFALGIETIGGNYFKLIEKKTKLPIKISTKIKTVMDNQPRIHLKFYLGDRPIADLNKFVAELKLKILKPEKKGQEIDLELKLSRSAYSSNILTGLSKDSIAEIDHNTFENREKDMKQFILNNARVEADKKILILENLINEHKVKLLKSESFDESEFTEDLVLFNKIVNENLRDQLLDCEETIGENIEFINKIIYDRI